MVDQGKPGLEIWSPLPPQASGVADYVAEQLDALATTFDLTLIAELPSETEPSLRDRFRVITPLESDPSHLRLYHVGNSPLHRFIYQEALRVPGVVALHEWNLHELLLGFAVASNDFDGYRQTMRREHGERGSIAAETIASALGGKHWTSVFPLNADIISRALGVVCLSGSTATKVAARDPGGRLLLLPHHALLKSHTTGRSEARRKLGLDDSARVVLMPGLATSAKAMDTARSAIEAIRAEVRGLTVVTVGGGNEVGSASAKAPWRDLGRVDLETLGDALLAADVVLALRFPSRGEASGVLMRALAAGRAAVVSAGSTADDDLPEGVVARVNPGPREAHELAAILKLLLLDQEARERVERLARSTAETRDVNQVTPLLSEFLIDIGRDRAALRTRIDERAAQGATVNRRFRSEIDAVASSLGLAHLPTNVFEKLSLVP